MVRVPSEGSDLGGSSSLGQRTTENQQVLSAARTALANTQRRGAVAEHRSCPRPPPHRRRFLKASSTT